MDNPFSLVYLSTKSTFDIRFFHSDYFPSSENDDDSSSASGVTKNGGKNKKNRNHKLLWDDKLRYDHDDVCFVYLCSP